MPTRAAPAYVGVGAYAALAAAAAYAACTVATGDPNPRHWALVDASGQTLLPGPAAGTRKVLVLPRAPPVALLTSVGPYVAAAAGAVAAGVAARDGIAATAAAAARAVRLTALLAASGAVAGRILGLW